MNTHKTGPDKAHRASPLTVLTMGTGDDMVGFFVLPAFMVTAAQIQTLLVEGRGVLCVAIGADRAEGLRLEPQKGADRAGAYTVTVDARSGITTGISAEDRARTIRLLADSNTQPDELVRPGHILPQVAHPAGVLGRLGVAEASTDLVKAAGYDGSAVFCGILDPTGGMAGRSHLEQVAAKTGASLISIDEVVRTRRLVGMPLTRHSDESLPTEFGQFRLVTYTDDVTGHVHYAVLSQVHPGSEAGVEAPAPLLNVHTACPKGEIFRWLGSPARTHLDRALTRLSRQGGLLVYLDQPGASDDVTVGTVVAVLRDLGITQVRLHEDATEIAATLGEAGVRVLRNFPGLDRRRSAALAVLSELS